MIRRGAGRRGRKPRASRHLTSTCLTSCSLILLYPCTQTSAPAHQRPKASLGAFCPMVPPSHADAALALEPKMSFQPLREFQFLPPSSPSLSLFYTPSPPPLLLELLPVPLVPVGPSGPRVPWVRWGLVRRRLSDPSGPEEKVRGNDRELSSLTESPASPVSPLSPLPCARRPQSGASPAALPYSHGPWRPLRPSQSFGSLDPHGTLQRLTRLSSGALVSPPCQVGLQLQRLQGDQEDLVPCQNPQ